MIDPEVVVVFSDLENRSNSRGEYFSVLKNYSWKDERRGNKRFPRGGAAKGGGCALAFNYLVRDKQYELWNKLFEI